MTLCFKGSNEFASIAQLWELELREEPLNIPVRGRSSGGIPKVPPVLLGVRQVDLLPSTIWCSAMSPFSHSRWWGDTTSTY